MLENQKEVTSLSEIVNNYTEIIELSPFSGDKPINVRVKQLSILGLCTRGVIPNPLLGIARKLFYKEEISKIDLKEYGSVLDIIAENVLIEPSVKELKENDIHLTDIQKFELYSYSQGGIKVLESFRELSKNNDDNIDGEKLQNKAKSDIEHK